MAPQLAQLVKLLSHTIKKKKRKDTELYVSPLTQTHTHTHVRVLLGDNTCTCTRHKDRRQKNKVETPSGPTSPQQTRQILQNSPGWPSESQQTFFTMANAVAGSTHGKAQIWQRRFLIRLYLIPLLSCSSAHFSWSRIDYPTWFS